MSALPNKYFVETMDEDEVNYIQNLYKKEKKKFSSSLKMALLFGTLIPLIFGVLLSLFTVDDDYIHENPDVETLTMSRLIIYMVVSLVVFLLILLAGFYLTYQKNIRPLSKDIISKKKIVEIGIIAQKKYMYQNDSYHFYLKDSSRLSIEIDKDMYNMLNEGDEFNFEYAYHSRLELGSF